MWLMNLWNCPSMEVAYVGYFKEVHTLIFSLFPPDYTPISDPGQGDFSELPALAQDDFF